MHFYIGIVMHRHFRSIIHVLHLIVAFCIVTSFFAFSSFPFSCSRETSLEKNVECKVIDA